MFVTCWKISFESIADSVLSSKNVNSVQMHSLTWKIRNVHMENPKKKKPRPSSSCLCDGIREASSSSQGDEIQSGKKIPDRLKKKDVSMVFQAS